MSNAPQQRHPREEKKRQQLIRAAGVAWVILVSIYIGLFIHWATCPL